MTGRFSLPGTRGASPGSVVLSAMPTPRLITALACLACASCGAREAEPPVAPAPAARTEPSRCKGAAAVTGPCYRTQGVVQLSGDRGTILAPDSGGALILLSVPGSEAGWPDNLDRAMETARTETGSIVAGVHGTFEVCPLPSDNPDQPEQAFVCVESADLLTTVPPS